MSDHQHNFYYQETKSVFEAFRLEVADTTPPDVTVFIDRVMENDLYIRVEYSYSSCACGEVLKQKVKVKDAN